MHEAHVQPAGDQGRLPVDHGTEKIAIFFRPTGNLGVMPGDRMIGKRHERVWIAAGRILERADTDVACGNASEHRPGQGRVAIDRFARRDDGQAPRRWNAEGVHRLADDVFAEHRPERRQAIAIPRKRRPPGALQLDVEPRARGRKLLAEEDRPAVAEHREVAVLVARIGLGDRLGPRGQDLAGEDRRGGCVGRVTK